MTKNIVLHTLSTGDEVIWLPENHSISISFTKLQKVLSTSLLNGGYREDLTAVFNHNCGSDDGSPCKLRADTYFEHMRIVAECAGLNPERVTGMGTAASMENVAIVTKKYQELIVTAIVTGGVECNGGRVGDPADYYVPIEKTAIHKPGTINIILVIDADMPPGTLTRALVTCTEAKTAALQELMAGSLYSTGLATGSGTDQSIIVANPESPIYLEDAGKHSKLGELIGLAVKEAVKEALLKQTGLCPEKQHSVLRRMKRFGVSAETLWQDYLTDGGEESKKEAFWQALMEWETESEAVTYTSLYVHLLDQLAWKLLSPAEVCETGNHIMAILGEKFGVSAVMANKADISLLVKAWAHLARACVLEGMNTRA